MFETLPPVALDPIVGMMDAFAADPRPDKIDLLVGVFKDAEGVTPVPRAVKAAEARLQAAQTTKTYTAFTGDQAFCKAVAELALGPLAARPMGLAQGIGGSGALALLFRVAQMARPETVFHLPDPTWPIHGGILKRTGLAYRSYPYLDRETQAVDFPAMAAALERLGPGDVVVLHACCHNPSGADLNASQWAEVAAIAARRGWVPLIDAAYLGFGDGLEADAAGMQTVVEAVPEAMVAISCSKNFGIYRERAGVACVIGAEARARAAMAAAAREFYSFPPDHGAAVVRTILGDAELRADWEAELAEMRTRLGATRRALAEALRRRSGGDRFGFIAAHRGMFSLLGLEEDQVNRLREEFAVYVVPGGRVNIAGLGERDVDRFAEALLAVWR
jgi:aspartate/tyrosine/aromatic aminotransferase